MNDGRRARVDHPPSATATDVVVRRGGRTVLDHVSLRVSGWGLTLLGGPPGSGKSTLLSCLATLRVPDSGEITVLGTRLDERTAVSWTRAHIGYLPPHPTAPPGFTIDDLFHYSGWLARLEGSELVRAVAAATHRAALHLAGGTKVRRLSDGQRRRAFIAAAAIADPPLLLLDEPTAGIEDAARPAAHELLRGLSFGRAVLVATDDTHDIHPLADHVAVLAEGRVAFAGPRGAVRPTPPTPAHLTTADRDAAAPPGAPHRPPP